ncbi:hypothetical protein, partial [Ornithinicoccus halotolerans]|uniref:hypothetical protein n=1 Tax=Ornithinicoccus halotolerans TaxID=1748220 RepID=UPI001E49172C
MAVLLELRPLAPRALLAPPVLFVPPVLLAPPVLFVPPLLLAPPLLFVPPARDVEVLQQPEDGVGVAVGPPADR